MRFRTSGPQRPDPALRRVRNVHDGPPSVHTEARCSPDMRRTPRGGPPRAPPPPGCSCARRGARGRHRRGNIDALKTCSEIHEPVPERSISATCRRRRPDAGCQKHDGHLRESWFSTRARVWFIVVRKSEPSTDKAARSTARTCRRRATLAPCGRASPCVARC